MYNSYDSDDSRWQAVQTRDPLAATAFVYAVKTTHIYCRPTCPSRLARRANVVFYDTSAAARCAAFRPCKRCKPEQAVEPQPTADLVARACDRITELDGELTINDLAKDMMVSSRHLRTVFNNVKQCTPTAYAALVREMRQHELAKNDPVGLEEYCSYGTIPYDFHDSNPPSLSDYSTPTTESPEMREIEYYHSPSSYEQMSHFPILVDGDLLE